MPGRRSNIFGIAVRFHTVTPAVFDQSVDDGGSGAGSPPSSVISPGTNKVTAISAGPTHALALMTNQTVIGWGAGSATNTSGKTNITAISAGFKHSLVLNGNGAVSAKIQIQKYRGQTVQNTGVKPY